MVFHYLLLKPAVTVRGFEKALLAHNKSPMQLKIAHKSVIKMDATPLHELSCPYIKAKQVVFRLQDSVLVASYSYFVIGDDSAFSGEVSIRHQTIVNLYSTEHYGSYTQ